MSDRIEKARLITDLEDSKTLSNKINVNYTAGFYLVQVRGNTYRYNLQPKEKMIRWFRALLRTGLLNSRNEPKVIQALKELRQQRIRGIYIQYGDNQSMELKIHQLDTRTAEVLKNIVDNAIN